MQLYKSINDSSLVQPPGHSEHHTGLAADILPTALVTSGTPLDQQLDGSSPEEQWLADNSWAYGLILRYPPGTQHLTGIAFEPWHFRYVGLPHAWYMWHHDLTLEEYLCKLASVGGFDVTIDKQNYAVRYSTATDGVIYVPSDKYFTLSSTNRGSYIVTALSDERVD
jgi:D-alanyl-D-alanine carboxypeptidase